MFDGLDLPRKDKRISELALSGSERDLAASVIQSFYSTLLELAEPSIRWKRSGPWISRRSISPSIA